MTKEKTYSEKLMDQAKSNIGVGILGTVGTYGFARVGAAHPATAPVANAAVAGLQLVQVGKVAQTGLLIAEGFTGPGSTKRTGKTGDKYIDKMI